MRERGGEDMLLGRDLKTSGPHLTLGVLEPALLPACLPAGLPWRQGGELS